MSSACKGLIKKSDCYLKTANLQQGGIASDIYVAMHICDFSARKMVVKEIDNSSTNKEMVRGFKIHKSLNHPNIIALCSWFEEKDKLYNIIEYFEGGDLIDVKVDPGILCSVVKQILSGLIYLHKRKIIHRDIKPENILLNNEGLVKIIDFDMAIKVGNKAGTGGTMEYLSPETFDNEYSTSQDMWAFGTTLYSIITQKMFIDTKGHPMGQIMKLTQRKIDEKIDKNIANDVWRNLIKGTMRINASERLTAQEAYDYFICEMDLI